MPGQILTLILGTPFIPTQSVCTCLLWHSKTLLCTQPRLTIRLN